MSFNTITVIVECDLCNRSQIDIDVPSIDGIAWYIDRVLAEQGWWCRDDFRDICPNHPRPPQAAA